MQWLTPLTGLFAAAICVPTLLLMYFLKLKRQEQMVSSTLLWKRAVQDLKVNAPFQKLRRNLLFLLQLLALLVILLALAGPMLSLTAGPARYYVLLIDRPGSMNATDVTPNRLAQAKEQASVFVESLRGQAIFSLQDNSDQAMVIAFDAHSKVMCNFTSDKRQLLAAIEAITPGDGASLLVDAVHVAQAYTQAPGEETNNRSALAPPQLVLFSDGRIADADKLVLGKDEMIYNSIGETQDNIAIVAMQARRSYENPARIDVFATLANYSTTAKTTDVQLSIDENVLAIRSVLIGPRQNGSDQDDAYAEPGKVTVDFQLSHEGEGVLELRQLQADALSGDDAAWSILSSARKLSVLLVSEGNTVLESALRACPLDRLEIKSPAEFRGLDRTAMESWSSYDLIVLDNDVWTDLPRGRYLVFGQPPQGIDVSVEKILENQVMVDWRSNHPVMKYVNPSDVFAGKCYQMALPRDAEILAEFSEAPAVALLRRKGSVFLLVGFDCLQTNWPFKPGFILFCYNATSFLGMQRAQTDLENLKAGEPIVVEDVPAGTLVTIDGPGFTGKKERSSPAGTLRFTGTDRVGVYRLREPDQPVRVFSVNLLDERESEIAPLKEIKLSGQTLPASSNPVTRSNVPLWPYAVALALILACVEWFVYNSRVRI